MMINFISDTNGPYKKTNTKTGTININTFPPVFPEARRIPSITLCDLC